MSIGGYSGDNLMSIGVTGMNMGMTHNTREDAQRFYKKMRRTMYQTTVRDLRKAGLNPILAIKGMSPGGLPGASSSPFTGAHDPSGLGVKHRQASIQARLADSNIQLQTAQKNVSDAQAALTLDTRRKIAEETRQARINADLDQMAFDYWQANPDHFKMKVAGEVGRPVQAWEWFRHIFDVDKPKGDYVSIHEEPERTKKKHQRTKQDRRRGVIAPYKYRPPGNARGIY